MASSNVPEELRTAAVGFDEDLKDLFNEHGGKADIQALIVSWQSMRLLDRLSKQFEALAALLAAFAKANLPVMTTPEPTTTTTTPEPIPVISTFNVSGK